MNFINYFISSLPQIGALTIEHIQLTAIALIFAIIIGVPLGILVKYVKSLSKPVIGVANITQAIPSIALLGFAIPLFGIGTLPAVIVVVLYSLLPIIKNTYIGLNGINPQTIEAARGIGLTKLQIMSRVQFPLALPVIMAGVRISAVTAVGLMTMAAFIGAGGLGFLIFSGIRTVNTYQILAGAIPACVLALVVDYVASVLEGLVTPLSLQKITNKEKLIKKRKGQKIVLSTMLAVVIAIIAYQSFSNIIRETRVVRIGTKDFTEQTILGHMVAELIEGNTDIYVDRKISLGGTQVCFGALRNNEIDMYVDYTGTLYGDILRYPPISDMQEVYAVAKQDMFDNYGLIVLEQLGFNNTYTLTVTQETAAKYNLSKISDLRRVAGNLTAGTTLEFLNRADGLPGVQEKYGFKFGRTIGIDGSPKYIALTNGETDVTDAFSTDGLLKKFDLVVLEDDMHFFPPYYAVPLVRPELVEEYPEVIELLYDLAGRLSDEIMTDLNYQVDELQREPRDVAREFLLEIGLI